MLRSKMILKRRLEFSYRLMIFFFDFSNKKAEETSKIAYLRNPYKVENLEKWNENILPIQYKQLWLDDNVGSFLVSVTIRKKRTYNRVKPFYM